MKQYLEKLISNTSLIVKVACLASFLLGPTVFNAQTLIHSYTFNDGTPFDSTGNADGIGYGTVTYVDGKAVLEEGEFTGEFISLDAEAIALNTYTSITIEAFITASTVNASNGGNGNASVFYFGNRDPNNTWKGYDYVYSQGTTGNSNGIAAISTTGNIGDPWVYEDKITGAPALNDGQLHHIVLTLDATKMAYYIDGVMIGSPVNYTGSNSLSAIGTELALIGNSGYNDDPTFKGEIDEFNIYDGVMDASTVAARANSYLLGVDSYETKNSLFKLHPNPTNNILNIQFNKDVSLKNVNIYNMQGQYLYSVKTSTIGIKNLQSGIYFLEIETNKGRLAKRLVVK
ncbi:LamG-like jellyroll fold domain-containing protein [Tamlana flava]|uniref:LamG-like jellyroll fold domain-containing protein n=1 Tax=Tamlana flava TaxID=3158572 RepID=UPI00351B8771